MEIKHCVVVFICLGLGASVNGANILFLLGVPSPSHHIWNRAFMSGVAANGHNITALSADVDKTSPPNIHYIHLENVYDALYKQEQKLDLFELAKMSPWQALFSVQDFVVLSCVGAMTSRGFQTILDYPDDFKFDLVVHDATTSPCLLVLLQKFKNPPVIGATPYGYPIYSESMIGGHKYPAYVPHTYLPLSVHMNFYERIVNWMFYKLELLHRYYVQIPKVDKAVRERVDFDFPYISDLFLKQQILLVNTNSAIDPPEPLPQNVIPVGGLQLQITPKELPKDFLEFIDSSAKGTVLFSLGTNIRSDFLSDETQKQFINAFKEMPQYNFIWKFESSQKHALPKNVIIRSWVPQSDMLAHPKVVGFISHSGGLSTHEALWHGKPIIAVPFIVDQIRNAHKVVTLGVAEKLDFQTVTTKSVKETVLKVLETPSYTQKIQAISRAFQDQKETPLERAVWWVEWSLRNPSPSHMISPTIRLGSFAANSYDVLLFFLAVPLLIIAAIFKCVRKCTKSTNKRHTKDKKNK